MGYFKNISVNYFRNFDKFDLELSKNCNVFYGDNGCGKTNLLEAISLCSKGAGIRKDKIINFINKDKKFFSNILNFEDKKIEYEFKIKSETDNQLSYAIKLLNG